MSDVSGVKAIVFDCWAAVVDLAHKPDRRLHEWADTRASGGLDRAGRGWRAVYAARWTRCEKHPERGYVILDTFTPVLEKLVAQFSISGLGRGGPASFDHGWHRLNPWPDSVSGLTRLKRNSSSLRCRTATVALLTNMAKFAGLPWDLVLSAELFEHYKPDPKPISRGKTARPAPQQVMMGGRA